MRTRCSRYMLPGFYRRVLHSSGHGSSCTDFGQQAARRESSTWHNTGVPQWFNVISVPGGGP